MDFFVCRKKYVYTERFTAADWLKMKSSFLARIYFQQKVVVALGQRSNKSDSSSLMEISANYDEDENLKDLSNFMLVEKPNEFEIENTINVHGLPNI